MLLHQCLTSRARLCCLMITAGKCVALSLAQLLSQHGALLAPSGKYWLHPRYLFRSKTLNLPLLKPHQTTDTFSRLPEISSMYHPSFRYSNIYNLGRLGSESVSSIENHSPSWAPGNIFGCEVIGCHQGAGLETCLRIKKLMIDFIVGMRLKTLSA